MTKCKGQQRVVMKDLILDRELSINNFEAKAYW